MHASLRYLLTFALTTLALTTATGGCSSIGEAIDCEQMCNELRTCVDSHVDIQRCSERCEDEAEDDALADRLDDCTDCLDHDYACAELPTHCAVCQDAADALWE